MVHTSILSTDTEFDALRQEWDELLESSGQRVFFLRWNWVRAWWRHYAPPGSQLAIVTCRDAAGRLIGLAPLYKRTVRRFKVLQLEEICFLGTGDVRMSEHLDVIARWGWEERVGRCVGEKLRQRVRWDRVWLWSIPAASTVLPHLHAALGPKAAVRVCDYTYVVDTSGGWERTRIGVRHDVDRTLRQALADTGAGESRVQVPGEVQTALDDLVRLHQLRWQAKGLPGSFADPRFEPFLRAMAGECFARGRLGLWRFFSGSRCVAALIAFVDFGTAHYFQSGFEPKFPHSLGQVIVGLAVRDCAASTGVSRFDLMGGEAGYKQAWTEQSVEMRELEGLRGVRGRLFGELRRLREGLARLRRSYRSARLDSAR